MRVQSCVSPLSLVIFSNTVPCGKTIYLVDIVYGFRITQHIVLLSFPLPFPRFGGRAGGVVVHLSYFQTFNFLCEIIVNLFVQRILFFFVLFFPLWVFLEALLQSGITRSESAHGGTVAPRSEEGQVPVSRHRYLGYSTDKGGAGAQGVAVEPGLESRCVQNPGLGCGCTWADSSCRAQGTGDPSVVVSPSTEIYVYFSVLKCSLDSS